MGQFMTEERKAAKTMEEKLESRIKAASVETLAAAKTAPTLAETAHAILTQEEGKEPPLALLVSSPSSPDENTVKESSGSSANVPQFFTFGVGTSRESSPSSASPSMIKLWQDSFKQFEERMSKLEVETSRQLVAIRYQCACYDNRSNFESTVYDIGAKIEALRNRGFELSPPQPSGELHVVSRDPDSNKSEDSAKEPSSAPSKPAAAAIVLPLIQLGEQTPDKRESTIEDAIKAVRASSETQMKTQTILVAGLKALQRVISDFLHIRIRLEGIDDPSPAAAAEIRPKGPTFVKEPSSPKKALERRMGGEMRPALSPANLTEAVTIKPIATPASELVSREAFENFMRVVQGQIAAKVDWKRTDAIELAVKKLMDVSAKHGGDIEKVAGETRAGEKALEQDAAELAQKVCCAIFMRGRRKDWKSS